MLPFAVLTTRQKEAIRQRDGYQCNFPEHLNGHKHECGGRLEIHHVLPQGYCREFGIDPDYPENTLCICRNAHDKIHPDSAYARKHYRPKGDSFTIAFDNREKLIAERKIYWNPSWDRQMSAKAVQNTQNARNEGWEFPAKKEFEHELP